MEKVDLIAALREFQPFLDRVGAEVKTRDWRYKKEKYYKLIIKWGPVREDNTIIQTSKVA